MTTSFVEEVGGFWSACRTFRVFNTNNLKDYGPLTLRLAGHK